MKDKQVQAVLFDLGDTLIDFGRLDHSHLLQQASRRSYAYLQELKQPVGSYSMYCIRNGLGIRLRLLWSFLSGNDFDSLSSLKRFGNKKGFTLSEAQWEELNWKWYEPLVDCACTEADLHQTLESLRRMGFKLGIVSNTFVHGSSLDRHLDSLGLNDLFGLRIYSYQFSFRKPDRRIFLEASSQLSIDPSAIVFVGDRIDKDVQGALNAGMIPVLKKAYTNEGKHPPSGVAVINRIGQLPELLKNCTRGQVEEPMAVVK